MKLKYEFIDITDPLKPQEDDVYSDAPPVLKVTVEDTNCTYLVKYDPTRKCLFCGKYTVWVWYWDSDHRHDPESATGWMSRSNGCANCGDERSPSFYKAFRKELNRVMGLRKAKLKEIIEREYSDPILQLQL